MRALEQIESEIRRITALVVKPSDTATLECMIDGTASGISGAFIEALDRADGTGQASQKLHELLVEYADRIGESEVGVVPRTVLLRFASGETFISSR